MAAWIGVGLGTAVVAVIAVTAAWRNCAEPKQGRPLPLVNQAYDGGNGSEEAYGESTEFGMSDSTV